MIDDEDNESDEIQEITMLEFTSTLQWAHDLVNEMEKRILECLDNIPILQIRWSVAHFLILPSELTLNLGMLTDLQSI